MVELVILLFTNSCCNTLPRVTTGQATEIERTSAKCGGVVEDDGGGNCDCTERGVCWSTNPSPTISDSRTSDGVGIGSFTSNLTQLTTNTPYQVRAYATNAQGTSYGTEITITTKDITLPTLETSPVTSITKTTAVSGGTNIDDGGSPIIAKGVCWGKTENPDLTNKTNDGSGLEAFTSNITELQPGTSYFVRAYATNSKGTNYGLNKPFTTTCAAPAATTNLPSAISTTSATLNGTVNANGNNCSTVVVFEYGTTTSYGSTITATPGTVTGTSNIAVSATITGLTPGQTYHYRVNATNSGGITNGSDLTVTPVCTAPSATTTAASGVGTTTATLNGIVNANNSSITVTFEYGTTTSYGSTIAATPSPVTGNSNTAVTATLTGLTPGQTYHYRVKAVNCGGTTYGLDQPVGMGCTAPSATSNLASAVGTTSATLNGTVNANNSSTTVTFEYGTTTSYGSTKTAAQSPVTGNSNTPVSATTTGLTPGQTYHYRVIGTNCGGTSNGSDQTFTTGCMVPSATTDPASPVGTTTATLKGTVNANNSSTTVTFEYGLTNSYGNTVTATPSPVTGISNTSVSAGITGLTTGQTYHYRVKAINCGGTTYGLDQTLTTGCTAPSATSDPASPVGTTTATLKGTVNANNSSTTVTFEYGLTTSYGSTITATPSPVTGNSSTAVSAGITGLTPCTVFHYRVKSVNCGGTTYGSDKTLTTNGTAPSASISTATPVGTTTATLRGIVNANNSSTTVTFEYGTTTSYGSVITATPSPVTGSSNTAVSANITGLSPCTIYYYRVKAVNCGGTTYSTGTYLTTTCAANSFVQHLGIVQTNINLSTVKTMGQITINPTVSGRVIVSFDGQCWLSPGDRIVLAASNTASWGINDGHTEIEAIDANLNLRPFSHTRVYDVSAGSRTFYAVAQNYVETDGTGIASIAGSLTVQFIPASTSIVGFTGISKSGLNLVNETTVGAVTINPTVSGKAIVKFDGFCISSPGDRIVLAASNTTSWGVNDGSVGVEAANSDIDQNSFSHTRVYDVSAGSRTFYAVAQNYVETAGTGIASIYGSLTVHFIPTSGSVVASSGIQKTLINMSNSTVLGQVTINPSVSGKVLVRFDGYCISSPGDRIVLAASNTTSWSVNDGNVGVEAVNSDVDSNSFSHTRVYTVSAGSSTFYAIGHNYVETAGTGIASVYGTLTVIFFPNP